MATDDPDQWRAGAECRTDPDPDRWVELPPIRLHGRTNPAYDQHLGELKQICAACPVKGMCLREAIRLDVEGVFAGTDEYERADLRETYGIPEPPLFPLPENDSDERLMRQRFEMRRLARRGMPNKAIAAAFGVSTMTVSRFTTDPDDDSARAQRGHRHTTPAPGEDTAAVAAAPHVA